MAKRHVYTGMYTRHRRRTPHSMAPRSQSTSKSFKHFFNLVSQYVWTGYNMMYGNYLVLATVFAVVLLSFIIPDISQKIHATTELNSIKKVLDVMTAFHKDENTEHFLAENRLSSDRWGLPTVLQPRPTAEIAFQNTKELKEEEVNRAEAACLSAADEICYLQYSMQDGTTETPRHVQDLSVCTSECMSAAVSKPVQVERQIGVFQRILYPHTNTSHKEIAIMSYLYTDSFNAEKTITN